MRPADAHDAGCLGSSCPKYAQLMLMMLALMMLAVWGRCSKVRPADAHDALRPKCAQLMLMMLAVCSLCV